MRSIFWKIFLVLWFTCTLVVMISAILLYMKMVDAAYQQRWERTFEPQVQGLVKTYEWRLQRLPQRLRGRAGARFTLPYDYGLNIIVLSEDNGRLVYGNPAELGASDWKTFRYVSDQGSAYQVKIPPVDMDIVEGAYQFFETVSPYRLWFTALVSAAFSLLLALVIIRPIKRLKSHIEIMGGGELDTRLDSKLTRRRDEFGELARSFNSMAERIQSLVNSKQQLLHDVSHELRAPLARLQVAGELARCEAEVAGISGSMYDRVDRECVALNKLINEILTLSRMEVEEAGPEQRTPCELPELVQQMIADARFLHPGRDIFLQVKGRSRPANILVGLLEKAFKNILENAIKYSVDGPVEALLKFDRKCAVISVADRGPGMPREDLDNIFTPFYRAKAYNSKEGYGLGMSITLKSVQQLGGEISAANRSGGGLKVSISLPLGI